MKGDKSFKLGPAAQEVIIVFKVTHSIKQDREALEKFILDAQHTRDYLQYFLTHRSAKDEDPACLRRIGPFNGSFFCAKGAPRVVELELGLDICKACKWKVFLTDVKTEPARARAILAALEEPPLVSIGKAEPLRIYCHTGGLEVFQDSCIVCKTKTYARWYECKDRPR